MWQWDTENEKKIKNYSVQKVLINLSLLVLFVPNYHEQTLYIINHFFIAFSATGAPFFILAYDRHALCRCFWHVLGVKNMLFFFKSKIKQMTKISSRIQYIQDAKIYGSYCQAKHKTKTFVLSLKHCLAPLLQKA